MSTAISIERLSKTYRLGAIGGATLQADVSRWWAQLRGRPDPTAIVGQEPRVRGQEFKALDDVSVEVASGEVLGIIGRNGAGKSTLLKILSRVTAPTSGRVRIRGRIASLLEVGTGFHPELTGRENIFLNGAILGMRSAEIRAKLDEVVAFAEVGAFVDTPVKRYSSGMYVRLAFAVAAHLEPEILVVDEVLAVGDLAFQKKCLGKMSDVARHGRTILFVSHNLDAVNTLCTRSILLRDGKLEAQGATPHIIARYLGDQLSQVPQVSFPHKPGDARFIEASLRNSTGVVTSTFAMGEPISLACRFDVARPLRGLQATMSVLNGKGERLFYSSNAMTSPSFSVETAGEYNIEAVIPGTLMLPGRYSVNIALDQPNVETHDFHEQVLAFDVVAVDRDYSLFQTGAMGHVRADIAWNQQAPNR